MITTENSARMFANKLVKYFYEENREGIEKARKNGNIGEVYAKELEDLRKQYIQGVNPAITNTTQFLNKALTKIVLKKEWKSKIERSTGIPIVIGGLCYGRCGDGYSGETTKLDDTVQKEAEILLNLFGKDIEIRFNHDRHGGGAWIKNNDGSAQVGLSAGLKTVFPNGMNYHDYLKAEFGLETIFSQPWTKRREVETAIEKLPKRIYIATYVGVDVLKDGEAENYPEDENSEETKGYWRYEGSISITHDSLDKAVAWLKKNVNPAKIKSI
jgi:hypothetical protein